MFAWSVGSLAVGVLGSVLAWAIRRYRKSVGRDLQSFTAYVYGSIRLSVGRRFSPLLASQFGIRQYANRVLAVFPRYLAIPSIHQFKLEMERAYIRLSLSSSPHRKLQDTSLLAHQPGSILIFGEPGSGKSSLTRKLFREACLEAYVRPFQSRLPVHIELGRLNWDAVPKDDGGRWLMNELEAAVLEVKGLHDPGFVFRVFADGPGIIAFLDGLDEIPSNAIQSAIVATEGAIRRLRHRSPSTSVIITSRSQLRASLPGRYVRSFDEVLTIEPFSLADIFVLLRRWNFAAAPLLEAQRIFGQLRSNPTLLEMCTNPLVLSMYIAYDQRVADAAASARLPDTRTEFYREVIGELLFFRLQAQVAGPTVAGSQVRKAREQLLGHIAIDHLGLRAHPEVMTVCRDRSGGMADGPRHGTPHAVRFGET
jgi:GTPase SAR1 family protein